MPPTYSEPILEAMTSTTVHIPEDLLEAVDRRAAANGVSRNRFIVWALESLIRHEEEWSPGFLQELQRPLAQADRDAIDEMLAAILARRTRKPRPELGS